MPPYLVVRRKFDVANKGEIAIHLSDVIDFRPSRVIRVLLNIDHTEKDID